MAPKSVWIDLHPADLKKLGVCKSSMDPFTKEDWTRMRSISTRGSVMKDPKLRRLSKEMLSLGRRCDLEIILNKRGP